MAHIKLPEFEEMTPAIQAKAKPILEKTSHKEPHHDPHQ